MLRVEVDARVGQLAKASGIHASTWLCRSVALRDLGPDDLRLLIGQGHRPALAHAARARAPHAHASTASKIERISRW